MPFATAGGHFLTAVYLCQNILGPNIFHGDRRSGRKPLLGHDMLDCNKPVSARCGSRDGNNGRPESFDFGRVYGDARRNRESLGRVCGLNHLGIADEKGSDLKVLALETSSFHGSVALLDGQMLLASRALPDDSRSAESLAPTIREVLTSVGVTPRAIELVAVTVGPGSFTGLRVGVTTAKTFAYAVSAAVVGVNTLEVLANQVAATNEGRVVGVV
ncbi:MAG: tRNA (adenosine(37)-N6)-threonylcarbamoyltransferase complex dimerization subunit type 1 TsaB, partial [Planctomycetales bacterium]|nr:tRNA (adenosine(37)-N6)-threonylcarbamoyltransferase complex dimerization subunit type 1 TsaB [Planctomycetales bacterium]